MLQLVAHGVGQRERERDGGGPPFLYPSIPHSQSLFVSTATASCVSLTTPPLPPHQHSTAPSPPPQPPPPPLANAVIITVLQRHRESGQEWGRRDVDGGDRKGKEMEGEENGRNGGGKGKGKGRGKQKAGRWRGINAGIEEDGGGKNPGIDKDEK
ncbi:hypothetical protein D9C73_013450 [Collichthys lucidus]|uniref:Uncharacterized protein n=1 Tax=Collichthys lucidus TaxID=240159 RepID=A0A4U5UYA4_COLLU|nr:hypothetical protein D9C73_013450 [Collichthys lucidus]